MSRKYRRIVLSVALAGLTAAYTVTCVAGPQRSIVELFTSQGCSSCPPADALLGRLSADPALLALSFHVNYWNSIGWKDPFSSQISTDRQYTYAHALGERTVFTPQLIVNGTRSVIGSQENEIRKEIAKASGWQLQPATRRTGRRRGCLGGPLRATLSYEDPRGRKRWPRVGDLQRCRAAASTGTIPTRCVETGAAASAGRRARGPRSEALRRPHTGRGCCEPV
jgi:hypothetical protein